MALVEMTTRRTSGFGSTVTSFFDGLLNWNATRSTRKALMKLTERELDDIGLNRADIELMTFTRRG